MRYRIIKIYPDNEVGTLRRSYETYFSARTEAISIADGCKMGCIYEVRDINARVLFSVSARDMKEKLKVLKPKEE